MEYYRTKMIECGYIAAEGSPIKCFHCNSKNMEKYNKYYDSAWGLVIFSVRCKDCQKDILTRFYGDWYVLREYKNNVSFTKV